MTTKRDPFGGILLSDEAILTTELTLDEKVGLGLMADPKNRDDSLAQLVAKGPYNKSRFADIRYRLKTKKIIRLTIGGKYPNSVRVIRIEPRFDGRRDGYSVLIHGELLAKIRATSKRATDVAILLTMLYVREQIRRGLVMLHDTDAAKALSLSPQQVTRARRKLVAGNVLVAVESSYHRPVYAIPDALVQPDPTRFMPEALYDLLADLKTTDPLDLCLDAEALSAPAHDRFEDYPRSFRGQGAIVSGTRDDRFEDKSTTANKANNQHYDADASLGESKPSSSSPETSSRDDFASKSKTQGEARMESRADSERQAASSVDNFNEDTDSELAVLRRQWKEGTISADEWKRRSRKLAPF